MGIFEFMGCALPSCLLGGGTLLLLLESQALESGHVQVVLIHGFAHAQRSLRAQRVASRGSHWDLVDLLPASKQIVALRSAGSAHNASVL
jgi:hypothetical protein